MTNNFKVTLGLCKVVVWASDKTDAIAEARETLCKRWPQHRDMIMSKPDSKFLVEAV
jgi:hypothetical protein